MMVAIARLNNRLREVVVILTHILIIFVSEYLICLVYDRIGFPEQGRVLLDLNLIMTHFR